MHRWIAISIVLLASSLSIATAHCVASPLSSGQVSAQSPSPSLDQPRTEIPSGPVPENLATLLLEKSNLPLSPPSGPVLSKIEGAGYTRELVQLKWRPADPIDVYIVRPKGIKNSPVILYLYDFTSDIDRFRDDGWCTRMTRNGFAAVGFVSSLSGQRLHAPRPLKQWFVSELQEALASSSHDVQMILNYLETRGDLDAGSVGMFGQGSGGAVAILTAAVDSRIKALDVIDPWGDWPEWLRDSQQVPGEERALYLTPNFLQKVVGLDPVSFLPELKVKALRVEQTLDDPVTPQAARDKLAQATPHENQVIRYKDWSVFRQAYDKTRLSAWLEAQLRPDTGANAAKEVNVN